LATREQSRPNARLPVLVVAALVSLTTAYIWSKVQMAKTLRQVETAHAQIRSLEEERDKLTAAIAMNKKPGAIRARAQWELGMIDPGGTPAKAANVHTQ